MKIWTKITITSGGTLTLIAIATSAARFGMRATETRLQSFIEVVPSIQKTSELVREIAADGYLFIVIALRDR